VVVLLVAIVILVVALAALLYAARRSSPHVRAQRERIREAGGPRGADFDSYAADQIDRLPIPPGEGLRERPAPERRQVISRRERQFFE
jgi:hypothetical protein